VAFETYYGGWLCLPLWGCFSDIPDIEYGLAYGLVF